ncbi:uncharacterized protein LOC126764656 [Bactrocera neohumeralis]|uniref:uncharacterized protein LOC126764656 n=1 Tax=Bactrocera neohumeralis TaxID=98809 RepID=UPI0021658978|nr:uncharacterized protein LOC126764656 [Bactrocera neohumeralis]
MDIPFAVSWKDSVATTGGEVSNLFASFFGSIYAGKLNENGEPMPTAQAAEALTSYDVKLSELTIRFDEVYEQMCKLDGKKGAGPDGIPNILLKSCVVGLVEPITHIFSKSLEMGIFPSAWKRSYICPIYKAESRSEVSNYRPICIQHSFAAGEFRLQEYDLDQATWVLWRQVYDYKPLPVCRPRTESVGQG